jgi:hypothetical protein
MILRKAKGCGRGKQKNSEGTFEHGDPLKTGIRGAE